jgi:hypothetical protein
MLIDFLTSPVLPKTINNGSKIKRNAPEIQDYPKEADNGIYYINFSSKPQIQINQTLQSKLKLPWLMISLYLIMSRVVTYKIKWHGNKTEDAQLNTSNRE